MPDVTYDKIGTTGLPHYEGKAGVTEWFTLLVGFGVGVGNLDILSVGVLAIGSVLGVLKFERAILYSRIYEKRPRPPFGSYIPAVLGTSVVHVLGIDLPAFLARSIAPYFQWQFWSDKKRPFNRWLLNKQMQPDAAFAAPLICSLYCSLVQYFCKFNMNIRREEQ